MLSLLFVASALVAYASAHSPECTAAITQIAMDTDARTCLNLEGLREFANPSSADEPLVPIVDNWLTGLCATGPCSDETLAFIMGHVAAGCATDFGLPEDVELDVLTAHLQQFYPVVRNILCLKDGEEHCITTTLTSLEPFVGTLTLGNAETHIAANASSIPLETFCTDCVKAAYNLVAEAHPGLVDAATISLVEGTCGATFTDGETPEGISQTAVEAGSTTEEGNTEV